MSGAFAPRAISAAYRQATERPSALHTRPIPLPRDSRPLLGCPVPSLTLVDYGAVKIGSGFPIRNTRMDGKIAVS